MVEPETVTLSENFDCAAPKLNLEAFLSSKDRALKMDLYGIS